MDTQSLEQKTDDVELVKSKAYIIVEMIEYMANSVVFATIIKKSSGTSASCPLIVECT